MHRGLVSHSELICFQASACTRNKDTTIGAPGIATRNKDATRAPGLLTRNKDTTKSKFKGHRY